MTRFDRGALLVRASVALSLLATVGTAAADTVGIPEPGVLELAALGGVVAIAVGWIRRRK